MPRTAITPQRITAAGLAPAYEPANVAGNSYKLQASRVLHVKNGSGGSVTVTIPSTATVDGLAVPNRTVTVAAGADRLVALGAGAAHKQTGGVTYVDYSAVTSVTVAVLDAA